MKSVVFGVLEPSLHQIPAMRKNPFLISLTLLFSPFFALAQQPYDRSPLTIFYQNQEYEQAINYLKSLPAGKETLQYKADLGYAYFMDENFTASRAEYSGIYQQQPTHKQANIYLAQLFDMMMEADSALFYYRHLTQLQPDNYRYWQNAARLFTQLKDLDSALVYIKKSNAINPRAGKVLVQYVNLLIQVKRPAPIDTLLNQFLSRDSSNKDVIAKRMDYSFNKPKPDYRTVIFWGERLLKDSADVVLPYVNLAYSYLNTDSVDKSIALCEWMLLNGKGGEQFLYCAALGYARKKNYTRSNELLDECIALNIQKEAVRYLNAKSDNYEEMKQYQMAVNYHDTAYYIFHSPFDLYYAGRLNDKYLKNKTKATAYYKQFMDKRRPSRNEGEERVVDYIKDYLKPYTQTKN